LIAINLPVGNVKSIQRLNLRKHYVEHYVSIKEKIISSIAAVKKEYNITFLSISIDLIQNEVQNKKMTGVWVSCIHESNIRSFNLAVRGYNPTREAIATTRASELLVDSGTILRQHTRTKCTK
jgi:hypothetical protein